jgi:hypothetical protein
VGVFIGANAGVCGRYGEEENLLHGVEVDYGISPRVSCEVAWLERVIIDILNYSRFLEFTQAPARTCRFHLACDSL